jgi:hypothetical protein
MRSLIALVCLTGSLGCAHWLPLAWHPIGDECPGPLAPVERIEPDRVWQAQYRLRADGREAALMLAGERRGPLFVLVGIDPVGSQVFVVVQRGEELTVEEHVKPLFPWPPANVLRDLHLAAFLEPGEFDAARVRRERGRAVIEHPACGTEAVVSVLPTGS